ncbi:hypothetical protein DFH06DRAFT_1087018 [Mycena polygramma]|nr:hypothetical protein DFH06DRAFT_1087018 [Mycena polygramma]
MASLTLDCHLDCDRLWGRQRGDPPIQLDYCPLYSDDTPASSDEWRMVSILDRPCLSMGDQVSVFRLQLIRPNFEPVDAALKIDHSGQRWKELEDEAAVYRELLYKFQGKIIPKFYGCFETSVDEKTITCLITEYSGKPVRTLLAAMDSAFLTNLLNIVNALHCSGAEHGDLDEGNILRGNDGRPILIDLERVKPRSCQRRLDFKPGVIASTEEEFGCSELYDLCIRMKCWKSRHYNFQGHCVRKSDVTSEEWAYKLVPDSARANPEDERSQEYLASAEDLWKTVEAERMPTWGTLEVTESTKRLDDPTR